MPFTMSSSSSNYSCRSSIASSNAICAAYYEIGSYKTPLSIGSGVTDWGRDFIGDYFMKLETFCGVILVGLLTRGDWIYCFKLGVGVAFLFKVSYYCAIRVAFSELTCYYDFKVSAYSTVVLMKFYSMFIWPTLCCLVSAFSLPRSNLLIFSRTLISIFFISMYTCNCFKNCLVSS